MLFYLAIGDQVTNSDLSTSRVRASRDHLKHVLSFVSNACTESQQPKSFQKTFQKVANRKKVTKSRTRINENPVSVN